MNSKTYAASKWQDCIVTYVDMHGVKSLLAKSSKEAIQLLRGMHKEVQSAAQGFAAHDEVCFWNDSVLLVGAADGPSDQYERIMKEVEIVKTAVDIVKRAYAICIKGRAIPAPDRRSRIVETGPNLIYLHASSLALSNCFLIEEKAKENKWRSDWYIDDRIVRHIDARHPDRIDGVDLWPRNRKCRLHRYKGTFRPTNEGESIAHR